MIAAISGRGERPSPRRYWTGTSGWVYRHWRGRFYPDDLKQRDWFAYYSRHFDTVEINNSFYRMPSEKAWRSWADRAPAGFCYAIKASRYITHRKRLIDCEAPLQLLAQRVALLGDHAGPILYQLPPNFRRDDARLDAFLRLLPAGFRHVMEFRHPSWFDDAVRDRLREAGAGFCIYHMPDLEAPRWVTGDFAYLRFHGAGDRYAGSYSEPTLLQWADWLRRLPPDVSDAFIYFNNDAEANAVRNALTLRGLLGAGRDLAVRRQQAVDERSWRRIDLLALGSGQQKSSQRPTAGS